MNNYIKRSLKINAQGLIFSNFSKFVKNHFTTAKILSYTCAVVAKSTTEPENSNKISLANSSTPFYYRAFFVRSTRTPKENALGVVLSMVACSGKGFALCCVPVIAVSQPVTRYRPNPEKFSGSLHKYSLELSKCFIHSFLLIPD